MGKEYREGVSGEQRGTADGLTTSSLRGSLRILTWMLGKVMEGHRLFCFCHCIEEIIYGKTKNVNAAVCLLERVEQSGFLW